MEMEKGKNCHNIHKEKWKGDIRREGERGAGEEGETL